MIDWNRWQQYQEAMRPWHWAIVVFVVFASVWVIVWLRAYFREDAEDADGTLEMLTQFRDLHQEGGLSDDEFRLIRSRLARTAKQAIQAGRDKSSAVPAEPGLQGFLEAKHDTPLDSPGLPVIVPPEESSSRMTDKETE